MQDTTRFDSVKEARIIKGYAEQLIDVSAVELLSILSITYQKCLEDYIDLTIEQEQRKKLDQPLVGMSWNDYFGLCCKIGDNMFIQITGKCKKEFKELRNKPAPPPTPTPIPASVVAPASKKSWF